MNFLVWIVIVLFMMAAHLQVVSEEKSYLMSISLCFIPETIIVRVNIPDSLLESGVPFASPSLDS